MKFCFWWIFEGLLKYTCLGILLQFLGITQKYSLQLLTLLVLDTIPPTCCQGRTHQLRISFWSNISTSKCNFSPWKKRKSCWRLCTFCQRDCVLCHVSQNLLLNAGQFCIQGVILIERRLNGGAAFSMQPFFYFLVRQQLVQWSGGLSSQILQLSWHSVGGLWVGYGCGAGVGNLTRASPTEEKIKTKKKNSSIE